ncbi:hypothetical protein JOC95_001795 [Bacillus tianshenii]|uniref:DUF4397 domain-containing protein n=1 Tax=Sutcliffiella tianshenii TaxID=1463404 RepID=A0ABS2NZN9_9BACI|nr:DUF4397 domain-containing protein [Bacillus tianshenii]MBM7619943.1 hypothetical protein [Bacillus tianshenii]
MNYYNHHYPYSNQQPMIRSDAHHNGFPYNFRQQPPTVDVTGEWKTDFGKMILKQENGNVTGEYSYQDGRINGRIEGTIGGNVLTGTWAESPSYAPPLNAGYLRFTFTGNSFAGTYAQGFSTGYGVRNWKGTRIPGTGPQPTPTPTPPEPFPWQGPQPGPAPATAITSARFVHAAVDLGNVDVYINRQKVYNNFSYTNVTGYDDVTTRSILVELYRADQNTKLFEELVQINPQYLYSLIFASNSQRVDLITLLNQKTNP